MIKMQTILYSCYKIANILIKETFNMNKNTKILKNQRIGKTIKIKGRENFFLNVIKFFIIILKNNES